VPPEVVSGQQLRHHMILRREEVGAKYALRLRRDRRTSELVALASGYTRDQMRS
jgi:hypothetical protein